MQNPAAMQTSSYQPSHGFADLVKGSAPSGSCRATASERGRADTIDGASVGCTVAPGREEETLSGSLLIAGEILCEFVRAGSGRGLGETGTFHGPFASGAPAIAASAAALVGADVTLVGRAGDDPFGRALVGRLRRDGIHGHGLALDPDRATGVAFVAYDEAGEREYVFHVEHAACAHLRSDDLADHPERVDWLHVSGATLQFSPRLASVVVEAAERVDAAGGRVSLDPNVRAEASGSSQVLEQLRRVAQLASVVTPSAGELAALGVDADQLRARGALVCETQGEQGAVLHGEMGVVEVPARPSESVDATGCGDTFAGVLVAALARGCDPVVAARAANHAAGAHVRALGPMEREPGWEQQVEDVLHDRVQERA